MPTHRILLAVTGLSPQIVTETLYALCVTQTPAWIPDSIHLITSQEGSERARLALLDPVHGQFPAFCRDYPQAAGIHFPPENIYCITGADGLPLSDIRTPEDNALAADAIHALLRQLTADPSNELHVSIAGGRKTMGFYLGYCLSLTARPQDQLSHVLVSEPFEALPDFYFPPATPRLLHTRDGRPIHTSDARVMLAEIPFVRLRPLLPPDALTGNLSFSAAVAATQSHLAPPHLEIHLSERRLRCGNHDIRLQPQLFAFYAWLAQRQHSGLPPVRHTDADPGEFLAIYVDTVGMDAVDYEKTVESLADGGFTKEFFEQKRARINSRLKTALGLAATPYLIAPHGQRPLTRYGLRLQPGQIHWHAPGKLAGS
ncbi:CRISPR-associated ring nuclease Csm6 [Azonexus sp.]|uniref:CRISPR-associated ring nuclease Csm6 n=1 Tax=Azonexus sp. TaxID=1872668 RepID=UPI0039E6D0C7